MPIILKKEDESKWLENIDAKQIRSLLYAYDDTELTAFPVSKLITQRGIKTNIPKAIEKFDYKDLDLKFLS